MLVSIRWRCTWAAWTLRHRVAYGGDWISGFAIVLALHRGIGMPSGDMIDAASDLAAAFGFYIQGMCFFHYDRNGFWLYRQSFVLGAFLASHRSNDSRIFILQQLSRETHSSS